MRCRKKELADGACDAVVMGSNVIRLRMAGNTVEGSRIFSDKAFHHPSTNHRGSQLQQGLPLPRLCRVTLCRALGLMPARRCWANMSSSIHLLTSFWKDSCSEGSRIYSCEGNVRNCINKNNKLILPILTAIYFSDQLVLESNYSIDLAITRNVKFTWHSR